MAERLFSNRHIWMLPEGKTVTVGITDYAQERLGNVMFLNLPEIGDRIKSGQRFGDIESIKTVSDLISPVDGEVIEVNEALVDEPEIINKEPYESWLMKVRVDLVSDNLMNEEIYLAKKENF